MAGCVAELLRSALDLLVEPGVWPAVKRMLRTKELEIQSFDPLFIFASVSLKPESIPLDVKVVLIGDPLHELLESSAIRNRLIK